MTEPNGGDQPSNWEPKTGNDHAFDTRQDDSVLERLRISFIEEDKI